MREHILHATPGPHLGPPTEKKVWTNPCALTSTSLKYDSFVCTYLDPVKHSPPLCIKLIENPEEPKNQKQDV